MTKYKEAGRRIALNLNLIALSVDSGTLKKIQGALDQIEKDARFLLESNAFEVDIEDVQEFANKNGLVLWSKEMSDQAMQILNKKERR